MEHVRDLHECQRLVPQKPRYVERCVAVYPIVRRVSADSLRHFRQVLRRNAQCIGIIRHLAVLPIVSVLEHVEKTAYQQSVLRRYAGLLIDYRMEIKEIEDRRLDQLMRFVSVFLTSRKGAEGSQRLLFFIGGRCQDCGKMGEVRGC